MVTQASLHNDPASPLDNSALIIYPDSDGQPMADNTLQFRWIVTIKENLECLFVEQPDVFVAGDLLWYPVEGNNTLRIAPDVLVVFGRPKGDRGSYKQWCEDGIAPQVVFEILSPGNRLREMLNKQAFYDRYGVEEYYVYDPDDQELVGWLRSSPVAGEPSRLEVINNLQDWVSPRLQIRFDLSGSELQIYRLDGQKFLTYTENFLRAEQERQRADKQQQRADEQQQRADQERQRAEFLAEQLRQLGVDPEQLKGS